MMKKTTKTTKTAKKKTPSPKRAADLFDEALAKLRPTAPSPAEKRRELLAQVAGAVAAGLVTSPTPSIASPSSMATAAVDIAEEILKRAGIPPTEVPAEGTSAAAGADGSSFDAAS